MTAQEMHRVCGTEDVVVEHRENCLCGKAGRAQPAEMAEERDWVFDSLGLEILNALDRKLVERDAEPMFRTRTERYNAAGKQVGTVAEIRRCDVLLYWNALDRVFEVLDRTAERQR